MAKLFTYLTFNGNCKEAMTFYQTCLGGELTFQNLDIIQEGTGKGATVRAVIVQACLKSEKIALMGSDLVADEGIYRGNAISLLMQCDSREEVLEYYSKLQRDGVGTYPLSVNEHGNLFGGLTDRFGTHWLFSEQNKNQQI